MLKQLLNNFFKLNKTRILLSSTLALSICTSNLEVYAANTHFVRLIIDGETKPIRVGNLTVSKLLEMNDIELNDKDIIDKDLNYLIQDDIAINIDKAENITFEIYNEEPVQFISNSGSIAVALEEFEKETGRKYKLEEGQSPAKELTNNMVIKVAPYSEKFKTINEKIDFETVYVENPNLLEGTERVKEEGAFGSKEIKMTETYVKGELESSTITSEKVIKEPVNKVIEKGTKKEVIEVIQQPKQEVKSVVKQQSTPVKKIEKNKSYKKKLTMKSTAYTAGAESTGKNPSDKNYAITASGMKAQKGVVAVDTDVIPFGTKLYIEGYGNAIAGDTGSAIKGNKIDVFVDSYNEAINWGVRTVDVYILE